MACRRPRRTSRGGRGRRAAGRGRRSRGQLLRTVRVQRRQRRNLRTRRGARNRDGTRGRQWRTPGPRGCAGPVRPCGVAGRERHGGDAGRGRIWSAGRLLHESLRAVACADSRRNSEQTREHENREQCGHHDGCAHDTRTHDKRFAHRLAFLAVTRRAAGRPSAPEAFRVPRRTRRFARLRERFGARHEIVIVPSHDSHPPRHRLITCPASLDGGQTPESTRPRSVGDRRSNPGNTGCVRGEAIRTPHR